jgi:hypothetical protein
MLDTSVSGRGGVLLGLGQCGLRLFLAAWHSALHGISRHVVRGNACVVPVGFWRVLLL